MGRDAGERRTIERSRRFVVPKSAAASIGGSAAQERLDKITCTATALSPAELRDARKIAATAMYLAKEVAACMPSARISPCDAARSAAQFATQIAWSQSMNVRAVAMISDVHTLVAEVLDPATYSSETLRVEQAIFDAESKMLLVPLFKK